MEICKKIKSNLFKLPLVIKIILLILVLGGIGFTIKTIFFSKKNTLTYKTTTLSKTTLVNSISATKSDLVVGSKIEVTGEQNTDGSVTGKTINLNPSVPVTPTK